MMDWHCLRKYLRVFGLLVAGIAVSSVVLSAVAGPVKAGTPQPGKVEVPVFVTGVSIRNLDNRSYKIKYEFNTVQSKLCLVAKPTAKIVKGIEPTGFRDKHEGIVVKDHQYNGIESTVTATISPNVYVYCLCTDDCVFYLEDKQKIENIGNGKLITIKDGKATVE